MDKRKKWTVIASILVFAVCWTMVIVATTGCDPTALSKQIDPDEALPHYGKSAPESPA